MAILATPNHSSLRLPPQADSPPLRHDATTRRILIHTLRDSRFIKNTLRVNAFLDRRGRPFGSALHGSSGASAIRQECVLSLSYGSIDIGNAPRRAYVSVTTGDREWTRCLEHGTGVSG
jgi:hypothetical protein